MIVRNEGGLIEPDDDWPGPHLIVAAYDPGIDTGWSCISYPIVSMMTVGVSKTLPGCEWEHGEISRNIRSEDFVENSDSEHVDAILDRGRALYEEHVDEDRGDIFVQVMERFDLRMLSMDPDLLAPVRILSVWRDRLRGTEAKRFYQTPSDAKRTVNDSRLAAWGMYDSHSGKHARDADRHAILFARRFMGNQELREKAGMPRLPRGIHRG